MDLASLHAFVAVIDTGTVSAAANSLHLTQSAISKRLQTLEQSLGVRVLDRLGRKLVLTEAGQRLLPQARQVLASADEARKAVLSDADAHGLEGRLAIATSHHIGLHRLPDALRNFVAAHPKVALNIEFVDSEDGCRAVEQGQIELAIVTLPLSPAPVLKLQPVWNDPLAFVVHKAHPLAKRETIDIAELAEHPAVLPDRSTFTHRIIAAALARANTHPQVRMTTNYLETIKMLVEIGLGWSALPATMLGDGLVALPVTATIQLPISRHLGIVTHRKRTMSRIATALNSSIISSANCDPLSPDHSET